MFGKKFTVHSSSLGQSTSLHVDLNFLGSEHDLFLSEPKCF